jgi:hypothetical protein
MRRGVLEPLPALETPLRIDKSSMRITQFEPGLMEQSHQQWHIKVMHGLDRRNNVICASQEEGAEQTQRISIVIFV